ncbi:ferrous iron transport protein B [Butyrivibrio sp. MC2013]|uniref:ferrous iron transport protein B n=1 Tax=Butyrivibrio sp. MC2013 TaxID=1280686 RepID=UPI000409B7E9|nr:ferrous iron transport protein B [Butyrivibrio sp. MC2013]
MTLRDLKIGEYGEVTTVGGTGALRQHFLDMGVIPGAELKVVKYAPMGDPIEILIHGYKLTLRLTECEKIDIKPIKSFSNIEEEDDPVKKTSESLTDAGQKASPHPGLGEGGKYHPKGSGSPLPEGEIITFALVGNQNSGKTTLFNQLTGSNQHVGNFPGVTVDRKDGPIKGHPGTMVTDLPGIYSMSPYTNEEIVSRNFVIKERPRGIINIVDATNIERNLYLTMQLLEMDIPMVVALNMMDEVTANSGSIDINAMEEMLGVPVVPISAAKNEGVDELIDHAIHVAYYQEKPLKQDFCDENDHGGQVHRCIHGISHLIEDHAAHAGLPLRFATSKVIEDDNLIIDQLALDSNEKETIRHIIIQMEKERGLDRSASIADMRFAYISKVCKKTVRKPHESKESLRSERIDRILTGKYTAIPVFFIIMALIFYLTFNVIGGGLQGLLETAIDSLSGIVDALLTRAGVNEAIHGLIIDGIFAGVGGVLSFLPIIVTLFFFLSMLEDSGYIARVAFVMDKLLRKIGLSGRSIVPLLIGFGCTVPAVMSSRTLPSERDRKMTIILTPFMSCTAKLPIYAFFVDAFFPRYKALIMVGLYMLGIVLGIAAALFAKIFTFKGEASPFVMELPNYRIPGLQNVIRLLWDKAKDFITRAFTIIFMATIIIWVLQTFDIGLNIVTDSRNSILAMISGFLVPILRPVGLGDWKIATSLISGFIAKESVVSTMEVLFEGNVTAALSPVSAVCLLVFSLLYTPCVAAIASIKRELGSKWALAVILAQCSIAWLASLVIYVTAIIIGIA